MPLAFLAPLFFAGLAALAIPIVVHLVHRERKEPLAFPSLMFLRRIPFRSARRQRIRNWLLFLLRCAALVLIAAAFARPWLNRPSAAGERAGNGRDVVVLLDNSYSMEQPAVWHRAQDAARGEIGSLGASDRAAVVVFGNTAHAVSRLSADHDRALAAIAAARPGSQATAYTPALKLAASLLADANRAAEVVLITDHQRNGWRAGERVELPDARLRSIDVGADDVANVTVAGVTFARSTFAGRDRLIPTARIANYAARAADVSVRLEVDGRTQQTQAVRVAARSAAAVRFDPIFAPAGELPAVIQIDAAGNEITRDDAWHFVLTRGGQISIKAAAATTGSLFYVTRALAVLNEPRVAIEQVAARQLGDLTTTDAVIFADTDLPGGEAGRKLEDFVTRGGGLVVIAGSGASSDHALLPAQTGRMISRDGAPVSVVAIDNGHFMFEPFRAGASAELSLARVQQYRSLQPKTDAIVLASFNDGQPALIERAVGKGRVVMVATALDGRGSDLVLQPAFVPFVHQLVRYAAGSSPVVARTVGQPVDLGEYVAASRDAIIATPAGERIRMRAGTARTLRLDEAGIYQIREAGDGGATRIIAANVDARESDPARISPAEIAAGIASTPRGAALAAAPLTPLERESGQAFWWYLLLVAFVLLAAETVLSNRVSRAWRV